MTQDQSVREAKMPDFMRLGKSTLDRLKSCKGYDEVCSDPSEIVRYGQIAMAYERLDGQTKQLVREWHTHRHGPNFLVHGTADGTAGVVEFRFGIPSWLLDDDPADVVDVVFRDRLLKRISQSRPVA